MKKYTTLAVTAASLLMLSACGGSSSKSTTITGKLIDAPVAGVAYSCGDVHATTKADGSFECHSYPVSFHVGGVSLGTIGEVPSDGYVTPQDLLGLTRDNYGAKVQNMAMFIQSLDDDGDIQERITLDAHAAKRLKETHANMHTINYEQTIELLEKAGAVHIATRDEATRHLQEHLAHLSHEGGHDQDHDANHDNGHQRNDHNGDHRMDHDNDHDNDHDAYDHDNNQHDDHGNGSRRNTQNDHHPEDHNRDQRDSRR